jgi:hypothetical protein
MPPSGTTSHESSMANMPIEAQKFLRGADYPATKDDLLRCAQQEGASEPVRRALESMPGDRFESPNDVSEALAKAS